MRWSALVLTGLAIGTSLPALAADLSVAPQGRDQVYAERGTSGGSVRTGLENCTPVRRRLTNSRTDPTYVGSPYGLARPSYYGFSPALLNEPLGSPHVPTCR